MYQEFPLNNSVIHKISRIILLLFIFFLPVFFISCEDEELLPLESYSLPTPTSASLINRGLLISGTSYNVGYLNGNIQSKKVTLTWSANNDENFMCYKIFKGSNEIKNISKRETTSFTDSLLSQNSVYKYSVAVITNYGTHKLDTITIKTPRFITPTLGYQVLSSNSLRLIWNKSAESATKYKLEKSTSPYPYNFQIIASPTDTFYVDNAVTNGSTYYYRITAYNPFESTPASEPIQITVNYNMYAPDLQPLYQLIPGRSVQLNWTDYSTGEDGFRIYRRKGLVGNFSEIGEVSTNITSFIDADTTALLIGSTFYYYVQGYNQVDTTARSEVRSITISSVITILNEGFESGTIPSGWLTGGYANWYASSAYPYSGNYCANSGSITDYQFTYLERTISFTGTKTISFYYRVSSEVNYDYLIFYINDVVWEYWSGEIDWTYYSTSINGAGGVTLRWEYSKDGVYSSGSDAAWIDNVIVQ